MIVTFSKAFASAGRLVARTARVMEYLRHTNRTQVSSASMPLASVNHRADVSEDYLIKEMERNMADRNEIAERVTKVVEETLRIDREKIKPESRFVEDLGADSLDRMTLVMQLEEEFKASITDEEAKELASVGAVVDFIVKKAAEKAA